MAITLSQYNNAEGKQYSGVSTDQKPTENVGVNDTFFELDTGKYYYYDGSEWGEIPAGGSTPTLQTKSVTITENGDTTVTADEGYDGLEQVNVSVDVPSSGGIPETPEDAVLFWSLRPFSMSKNDATKTWDGTVYYSYDYSTWSEWDATTTLTATLNSGFYTIYLRGVGNSVFTGTNYLSGLKFSNEIIYCRGNLDNLLDYTTTPTMGNYALGYLFRNCANVDFDVTLPNETLYQNCYAQMFFGCASLRKAPVLPAKTLASGCYSNMFQYCTALETEPIIQAETLANSCFNQMFQGCTSLVNIYPLPYTTLEYGCYEKMFSECTALTTLLALPATTLAQRCYLGMYSKCTGIKLSQTETDDYTTAYTVPSGGGGITANSALTDMFANTGGSWKGTPVINTTYYTSNTVISPS